MILNLLNLPLTTTSTSTNFALLTAFSQVSQLFLLINVLYVVFLACGGTTLCVQSKIPKHLLVKKKGLLYIFHLLKMAIYPLFTIEATDKQQ